MKQPSVTMKDIAQALNVSIATVSRALKDSYMISPETKQKILEYAEAHNYKPNLSAQYLKNKQTRSIGVSLSALNISFYSEVISGIESAATKHDYHIIISQCHESAQKEQQNLEHLQWRGVDGLLVALSSETEDLSIFSEILESGVPIVFFDRVPEGLKAHNVVSDNIGGSYQLTKEILKLGYQRIAQITSQPGLSITRERLKGYKQALEESNIPFRPEYVQHCIHGGKEMTEIEHALTTLMNLPQPPQVVFTASDRITMTCFSLIHKMGLHVPENLALAGFTSFEFPELFDPPLTTVSQQAFKMGETAMNLLIEQLESKHPTTDFKTVVIPTLVNLRKST